MYRALEDLGELERTVVDSSKLTVDQTAEHILATLDTRRLPQSHAPVDDRSTAPLPAQRARRLRRVRVISAGASSAVKWP